MWELLEAVGTVLFVLDALGLGVFVILYGVRSHWRATEVGRIVLRFMAALLAIMSAAIVLHFVGEGLLAEHVRLMLRVLLFGALLGGIVHLNVVLVRAQRRRSDEG
jgi:hypothetical protein